MEQLVGANEEGTLESAFGKVHIRYGCSNKSKPCTSSQSVPGCTLSHPLSLIAVLHPESSAVLQEDAVHWSVYIAELQMLTSFQKPLTQLP